MKYVKVCPTIISVLLMISITEATANEYKWFQYLRKGKDIMIIEVLNQVHYKEAAIVGTAKVANKATDFVIDSGLKFTKKTNPYLMLFLGAKNVVGNQMNHVKKTDKKELNVVQQFEKNSLELVRKKVEKGKEFASKVGEDVNKYKDRLSKKDDDDLTWTDKSARRALKATDYISETNNSNLDDLDEKGKLVKTAFAAVAIAAMVTVGEERAGERVAERVAERGVARVGARRVVEVCSKACEMARVSAENIQEHLEQGVELVRQGKEGAAERMEQLKEERQIYNAEKKLASKKEELYELTEEVEDPEERALIADKRNTETINAQMRTGNRQYQQNREIASSRRRTTQGLREEGRTDTANKLESVNASDITSRFRARQGQPNPYIEHMARLQGEDAAREEKITELTGEAAQYEEALQQLRTEVNEKRAARATERQTRREVRAIERTGETQPLLAGTGR